MRLFIQRYRCVGSACFLLLALPLSLLAGCGGSSNQGSGAVDGAADGPGSFDALATDGAAGQDASGPDGPADATPNPDGSQSPEAGLTCSAATPCIYIAQTASGKDSGADCSNAHGASWFNAASNWGSAAGQIGSGAIVHLCGTFTFPAQTTGLFVRGDGTDGHPITILFEPGAALQSTTLLGTLGTGCYDSLHNSTGCGGAIEIYKHNYITVDGAGSGVIQNTGTGSAAAQQPSTGLYLNGDHLLVKNLTIRHIYDNNAAEPNNQPGFNTACIAIDSATATAIEICNNTLANSHTGIALSGNASVSMTGPTGCDAPQAAAGINIYNNLLQDHAWHLGGGSSGTVNIYANEIDALDTDWTYPMGAAYYHTDGMILWGGSAKELFNIYNNYIHGGNIDQFIYCTHGSPGAGGSTCNIFNNLLVATAAGFWTNAIYWHSTDAQNPNMGPYNIYNNTMVGLGSNIGYFADTIKSSTQDAAIAVDIENNIMVGNTQASTCFYIAQEGDTLPWASYTLDTNDLSAGRQFGPFCMFGTRSLLSDWTSACQAGGGHGCDAHSIGGIGALGDPNLDSSDRPQGGSPAIGLGKNLSSLGWAPLNSDKPPSVGVGHAGSVGLPRPMSGAWDVGAYNH